MTDNDRIQTATHTGQTVMQDPYECYEDDESACAAVHDESSAGCDCCCCCCC